MKCPKCRLENPPEAQRCDCGYDFISGAMRQSYASPTSAPLRDVTATVQSYSRNHIIGQRWAATILDMFVFIIAFVIVANAFPDSNTGLIALGLAICLYYVVMEGRWGATLGKLATKLRIVDQAGVAPGYGRASVRTLLRLIEVNPIVAGGIPAGIIAFLSPTKQRLGDMLAGTYVLNAVDAERIRADRGQGRPAA